MKRALLLLLCAFSLTGCGERRRAAEYLKNVQEATNPAVEQAKVVGGVLESARGAGFAAAWPVLQKDLQELRQRTETAEHETKDLKVPDDATSIQTLVQQELTVLHQASDKGLEVGDKIANRPHGGFQIFKVLAELKPDLDQLKLLQAQGTDTGLKLKNALDDYKKKYHIN